MHQTDSAMPNTRTCSECGSSIPENAREGYCPKCLLALAQTAISEERSSSAQSVDPSNSIFGNYELLEQVGEGGMGVVYKARQQTLNRTVALKMIRSGSLASDSEIRRFRSEAQAAAKLQHPNVVAIHEVGEQDGRLFFSMDYIEGQSLAQVVRRTPLPPERAAGYVRTIAGAIHYAHQRGILHRDLKPANVIIDTNDQPRITDFGLAKQIEAASELTASGAVLGTPSYMPPEQAAGKRKEISPASDVYSLGAILYDLLTGRPPFRADTPVDTLRQVLDTEPAPPRLVNAKVPRDLETICLKCLVKEPHRRYQTAHDLADDLARFLKHEPIQARPVGRVGRLWRWCRRNPTVASLMGTVAVMFLMLAVAAMLFRKDMRGLTVFAAEKTADLISAELKKMENEVDRVSQISELPLLIERRDTNALFRFLEAQHNLILQDELIKWMGGTPFESWSLFDTNGGFLARWPDAAVPLKNFRAHDRDHFQGAISNAPRPYISRVYHSRTVTNQDQFGVSIAIKAGEREQAKIVAVLLATVTTTSTRPPIDTQHNAYIVLVGHTDLSDKLKPYAIMSHPAYTRASEAIRFDRFPAKLRSFYFDPAASQYPLYAGPWLPAIAPIDGTHFIVVVQTRDRVTDALATAALLTALAVLLFFGWRFVRRRGDTRAATDTQPICAFSMDNRCNTGKGVSPEDGQKLALNIAVYSLTH